MRWPLPAALALLLASPAALADVTVVSRFGFDGTHVPGSVTPVDIEVTSSEKEPVEVRFEVLPPRTLVGVGGEGMTYEASAFLAPGAKKRLTLPVLSRTSMVDAEWRLRIASSRRTLLRHGTQYEDAREMTVYVGSTGTGPPSQGFTAADSGAPVVGVLGDPSLGVAWLSRVGVDSQKLLRQGPWTGKAVASPGDKDFAALPAFVGISPSAAPDNWLCYEGFDAVLWIDPDTEALRDAARMDALLGWAANGGRLLVAATPGARLAADSPLTRALPARILGHGEAAPADVALALAGSLREKVEGGMIPLARLAGVRGRVRASLPDGRPLAVVADHGIGTVELLAFDPRLLSGSKDADRAALLRGHFGSLVRTEQNRNPNYGPGISLDPLVNHLRKRFLASPPLGLLILGLTLYVVAIGPADYYILKRRGKLRRTVITFPLIVVAFTLLAWGASFLLFGGHAGKVRVAWVDLATAPSGDADSMRGLDFLGAYSPTGTTLQVSYDQPREFIESPWLGSGAAFFDQGEGRTLSGSLAFGPDGRCAAAVDVPLRSQRTVQGRFSGEIPLALYAAVRSRDGSRVLEVRNGFKVRVRDLVLVEGDRARFLGDLEPGGRTEADLAAPGWTALSAGDDRLPSPYGPGGLFTGRGGQWRGTGPPIYFGSGEDGFVPPDDSEAAKAEARRGIARAAMGASLTGRTAAGTPVTDRQIRVLARQGIDLSRQVGEGRPVLLGWCEADPLGGLPGGAEAESTVVVVRRVLPMPGSEEGGE